MGSEISGGGGGGGSSPPFAISDITNLQTALDGKEPTITTLDLDKGGTNADLSATGGATHFLRQASAGAAVTVGAIAYTDLPILPGLRADRITSNQTGLSGSYAKNTVIFNSISKNVGPCWSEASGVYTCLIAGRYKIRSQVYNSTSSTFQQVTIMKGSVDVALSYLSVTGVLVVSIVAEVDFAVNDTFKVAVSAATAPVVDYANGWTWLEVERISA